MSSFLVLSEGDTGNRWRDGQVCPDVGQGTMAPWGQDGSGVFWRGCANRMREVKRDFCDLPIRRDEGRVVNTPLVFKSGSFSGEKDGDGKKKREKETEKERERGRTEKEREESRRRKKRRKGVGEFSPPCMEKRKSSPEIEVKKTMNAGGVENRID
ncbi:hypothetical protein TNCV_2253361 [Trichonephila clavipes]|nr:hypothetical protein TNCV_2253361 [Trichonephila clavipes]